jgi:hypothetical protein
LDENSSIVVAEPTVICYNPSGGKNMSVLEVDTAKRKFLPNKDFPVKKEQTMFEAFEELRLRMDERQRLNPHGLPELSEDEIDAICKEARRELRAKHPEIYAPN